MGRRTAAKKARTWRIRVDVTRQVIVKAATEADARRLGGERHIFDPGPTERVIDSSVMWLDDMDVSHLESCEGDHCRHYDCGPETEGHFCTTCDPECQ